MGKGWLVKTILTIVIIVLLILLCGPCILQCVVNFVSHRLNSFTQIYTRKPKIQYILMSDAHTGSWEHQERWMKEGRNRLSWLHLEKEGNSILHSQWTLGYKPACIFSELWTMCLIGHRYVISMANRPPRPVNTRFHTRISHLQKECNNPLCSQSPL